MHQRAVLDSCHTVSSQAALQIWLMWMLMVAMPVNYASSCRLKSVMPWLEGRDVRQLRSGVQLRRAGGRGLEETTGVWEQRG